MNIFFTSTAYNYINQGLMFFVSLSLQSSILWLRPDEDVQYHPEGNRRDRIPEEDQQERSHPHQETVPRERRGETRLPERWNNGYQKT